MSFDLADNDSYLARIIRSPHSVVELELRFLLETGFFIRLAVFPFLSTRRYANRNRLAMRFSRNHQRYFNLDGH